MQLRSVLAYHATLQRESTVARKLTAQLATQGGPANPAELVDCMRSAISRCHSPPDWGAADATQSWLAENCAEVVCWGDQRYPPMLAEIAMPPLLLLARGDLDLLNRPGIAVVGARKATRSGRETAQSLAAQLSELGVVVVSGLALGIDGAAHAGALAHRGSTIAVLGCGLDVSYPRQHRELAEKIVQDGLLVSEFPLGAQPLKHHFPRRNRVIAGMSLGTVVVEAAARSGSMSTANHALENGREVFAVPGHINNPMAVGCNNLIRQGARLTTGVGDIVDELPALGCYQTTARERKSDDFGDTQNDAHGLDLEPRNDVIESFGWSQFTIDDVVSSSGLTVQDVSSMLLALELEGRVEVHPNGTFSRIR